MLNFCTELNSCQKVHPIYEMFSMRSFFSDTRLNYYCTACTARHMHLPWRRSGFVNSPVSIQGRSERIGGVGRFKV